MKPKGFHSYDFPKEIILNEMQTKKRIIIKGRVHDVGYRLHLLEKAEELLIPNIGAWNVYKDRKEIVRVLVGGDDNKVKEFLHFIRESFPEEANVGDIAIEDYEGDIPTIEAFSRSFSTAQLTKIAKVGVGLLKKQDQMLDKQDETIEILGGKIDNVSSKIDNMSNKLDSFHQDTVQKFDNLRDDYGRISKDIALAVQGIERVVQNTEKLLEKSERDRAGFEKSMDKVANAILALAKSKA